MLPCACLQTHYTTTHIALFIPFRTSVQISKLLGARVVAVTRGADKAAYLQCLGADAIIDTAAAGAAGQRLHKLVAAAAPKGEL